ncbi:MAG: hypothetical protein ACFHVJ_14215 [Aestuariibacter sp.]
MHLVLLVWVYCVVFASYSVASNVIVAQSEQQSEVLNKTNDDTFKYRDKLREQLNGRKSISIRRTTGGWGVGRSYMIEVFSDGELRHWGLPRLNETKENGEENSKIDPKAYDRIEEEFLRLQDEHCSGYFITDQGWIHYRMLSESETIEFSVYTGCFSLEDSGQRLSEVIKDAIGLPKSSQKFEY